tara:strand:+ start:5846 stop:6166 length:321 start_codon:yes stop_codon:yes gene_type:complete
MEILLGLFIVNMTFIGVAFFINRDNAKYLLSGYNTMSRDQQKSFDLENYLIFFRKFFLNLALYTSLIFLMFYFAFGEVAASIAYVVSIILPTPYMVYASNKFKNKR